MKNKPFDLNMNSWGPYNKDYLGVCHIADPEHGATFNVELFPGFFRRKILASHATSDLGLKMWGANASLTRFSYRYELEWKDRVYCDADFVITDDTRCDITCTFVNNTDLTQSVNMNLCASLQYPVKKVGGARVGFIIPYEAKTVDGARFVDAIDYDHIVCAENLASDGRYLGEANFKNATGKSTALSGQYFFNNAHYVNYTLQKTDKKLLIRYLAEKDADLILEILGRQKRLSLKASNDFAVATLELCEHEDGDTLKIIPEGAVTIDSLILGQEVEKCEFHPIKYNVEAERKTDENKLTLYYEAIDKEYTIEWAEKVQMVRRYYYNDIGYALTLRIHNHVDPVLRTENAFCVYEDVLSEPLYLAPGEKKTLSFTVFSSRKEVAPKSANLYEVTSNSDGMPYAFSQNMMAYNTFLNVVYPIYTRHQYIRHNTPGRQWDSLYSWDSGFIGMGLATADFDRAFDCLNTYLTPIGDIHSPYIFHGSVVPTQIFLYQYLFNRYPQKREKLKDVYGMVKQLFNFYADMDKRDDQMKSGLLKTWNIFYNSGGWDDYPPQLYMHSEKSDGRDVGTHNTTPVITTAITVLIAKILRSLSRRMGFDDAADYDSAIEKYSAVLLKHAWNEETGYFSYVLHDENGNPKEYLKYEDGTDFNMGFDGIYPYIADITDVERDKRMLSNIKNGLLTKSGISVVDTRAPYFRNDGYWNGSVWMPHQWILWRSLLDHGEGDLAFRIADIALTLWKREVDETYCCFENFMIENGRGSGFAQFSGLSTPVLMFFESYYKPGTVTLGLSATVLSEKWNEDKTSLDLRYEANGKAPLALICLREGKEYSFISGTKELIARKVTAGAYEVEIPCGENEILIREKNS